MKPKSEFSRNVLTLMTGTTIAQAIPIAISPILTRIYTPEDFGVFAFFISIVAIFGSISSARYEQAILLPISEEDSFHIFALGFLLITFLSLFLLLLVFVFESCIVNIFQNQELAFFMYFVPITVFVVGLFNLLNYFNNRKREYSDMAKASVLKAVVLALTQVSIGFIKEGAHGLITGQILSQAAANVKLAKNIFRNKKFLEIFNLKKMKRVAVEHRRFPKFQVPHVLLSTTSSNLPVYIFTSFFSTTITGFYSLAIRIVLTPMMIIAGSSAKVYNERLSKRYENKEDTYSFSVEFLKNLSFKILPFIVLIAVFSPELFAFIFGEAWREAGTFTRILSPWLFLNVMVASIAFIPSLVGKQKKALNVSFVQLVLVLGAMGIGVVSENIYFTLLGFSIVNSIVLLYNLAWFLQELKTSTSQVER